MFFQQQDKDQQDYYRKMLRTFGALSRLFSESDEPFLDYRIAENLFCKAFQAVNLSRDDVSADASKNQLGVGIKTFVDKNGSSFEKIAEFNKDNPKYKDLKSLDKIRTVAGLRNARINFTQRTYRLNDLVYHCVTRGTHKIYVYEGDFDLIDEAAIRITSDTAASITFEDGRHSYRFNNSKSTLYKLFERRDELLETDVDILEDPFTLLEKLIEETEEPTILLPATKQPLLKHLLSDEALRKATPDKEIDETIYLPLYSVKNGRKYVPERSGLNQWNAAGRDRHPNEVYIPIPKWIHDNFPGFFPGRDVPFTLYLPGGRELSAKVCQDNSKALMSNPNKDLGEWLLRDVLELEPEELLTYDRLDLFDIDSVMIDKIDTDNYRIRFARAGKFEEFTAEYSD